MTLPFVDPDIAKAESLPPTAFAEPGFLARELDTIFARSWLLVPPRSAAELRTDPRSLTALLQRRGARSPVALLDRPLFLQRDMKGDLRCFPNVCTHAWHTLIEGAGREKMIVCPQHGRQFGADGRYLSQPGFKEIAPRECDHLRAFPVEQRQDYLFTCLGEPAMALNDVLGPMSESVVNLPEGEWPRAAHPTEVREVDGNWKQHAWNYMDKFHVAFIHKAPGGLADAIELAGYKTELHRWSALQWAYAREPAHGFDPRHLPKRFAEGLARRSATQGREGGKKRVFALWWFLWPNMTFNFYPWGLSVNVYAPVPGKPDRTLFHWYHFVADQAKYAKRDEVWLSGAVDAEDIDAIGQVRRGVASGYARPGRFAPGEEIGPHWFHRLVAEQVR